MKRSLSDPSGLSSKSLSDPGSGWQLLDTGAFVTDPNLTDTELDCVSDAIEARRASKKRTHPLTVGTVVATTLATAKFAYDWSGLIYYGGLAYRRRAWLLGLAKILA